LADENKIVASLYDMIHPGDDTFAKCLVCLLIIGADKSKINFNLSTYREELDDHFV
jgi:hypothetical protein